MGLPKIRDTIMGAPIIGIVIYVRVYIGVPPLGKLP